MPAWNTKQITEDLSTIITVTEIANHEPEDPYFTTGTLDITLGGVEDTLSVKGFNLEEIFLAEDEDANVAYVELTDGLTSGGGLNSVDYRLARAYIDVRQYFINRGFKVVPTMDVYF